MTSISIITQRYGPNNKQLERFASFIKTFDINQRSILIGGDRGDIQIYNILVSAGFQIGVLPMTGNESDFSFNLAKEIKPPMPMKERNQSLLDMSSTIIGLPQMMNEYEDSPCWKTLRNASNNREKEVFVISPSGWAWGLE